MWGATDTRFGGLYAARVHTVGSAGRLQVSVPAVFDTDDASALVWARACFPWAHYFLPQVGDQLWVAFENGDPSAPVWIGVWYPSSALPPTADDSKPLQRVIATPKQNIIVLDDTDDSETITITDKSGNSVALSKGGVLITSKNDLTIDASGHTVTIKAKDVNVQQG
jgi:uncharacterized protein involved in type VI secretion and phage assembly